VIAGYVLKLVRDSLGLSQEELARRLGQGKNTLQRWETGRRSLGSVRGSDFRRLLRALRGLGADPDPVQLLAAVLEADHFLHETLTTDLDAADPATHPLAMLVVQRDFADLLAWPFTGQAPSAVHGIVRAVRARAAGAGAAVGCPHAVLQASPGRRRAGVGIEPSSVPLRPPAKRVGPVVSAVGRDPLAGRGTGPTGRPRAAAAFHPHRDRLR
jgi:transcriptional regulator with XRE-family HTH domain